MSAPSGPMTAALLWAACLACGQPAADDVTTDPDEAADESAAPSSPSTAVPADDIPVLVGAKYPHPETVIPGGMSTTVSISTFNEIFSRLSQLFDYCKKTVGIWDDLCDFFYDVNPEYRKVGSRPANLIDTGIWDDPFAYDASYEHCNEWGERRWATPAS